MQQGALWDFSLNDCFSNFSSILYSNLDLIADSVSAPVPGTPLTPVRLMVQCFSMLIQRSQHPLREVYRIQKHPRNQLQLAANHYFSVKTSKSSAWGSRTSPSQETLVQVQYCFRTHQASVPAPVPVPKQIVQILLLYGQHHPCSCSTALTKVSP